MLNYAELSAFFRDFTYTSKLLWLAQRRELLTPNNNNNCFAAIKPYDWAGITDVADESNLSTRNTVEIKYARYSMCVCTFFCQAAINQYQLWHLLR